MGDSKTEAAWKRIFEVLPIESTLSEGRIFTISANKIKQLSGREPRLMTKFDTRADRPPVLRKAGVTILPVDNGRYALIACDGYHDLEPRQSPIPYAIDHVARFVTLPWDKGFVSESQVLDAALVASLVRTFTGEEEIFLTVRGRLRSPRFTFKLDTMFGRRILTVDGVQIEVDGGYEGERVYLIEAKMGQRDDFIIRQLYYPYRMWQELGVKKEIAPIVVTYSNKVISLRWYRFRDTETYNSIELFKSGDFILGPEEPRPTLLDILMATKPGPLPESTPFPQADDLQKVIDLVDAVVQGITDKETLAVTFEYDPRQSDYYGNAAVFLGLLERRPRGFAATEASQAFVIKTYMQRVIEITRRVASFPVFRDALEAIADGRTLSRDELSERIQLVAGLNATTAQRRARTVESWVEWIRKATASHA